MGSGDYKTAQLHYQHSLELARKAGNLAAAAGNLLGLGSLQIIGENYGQAETTLLECLALYTQINYQSGTASAYNNLGSLYSLRKDYSRAAQMYQKAISIRRVTAEVYELSGQLKDLAMALLMDAQVSSARPLLEEAFELACKIDQPLRILSVLPSLAIFMMNSKQEIWGAELLGLALHHPANHPFYIKQINQDVYPLFIEKLGPDTLDEAVRRGAARDLKTTCNEILDWFRVSNT